MTESHLNEEAQKMAKFKFRPPTVGLCGLKQRLQEITRFGNQVVKIKFRPAKKLKNLGFFGTPPD